MSGDRWRDGITVSGGAGGFAVALDDLTDLIPRLREHADVFQGAAMAVHGLDLWSVAAVRSGLDVARLMAEVEWDRMRLTGRLRALSDGLDTFVWRTRKVITGYWLAEQEAAVALQLARGAGVTATRVVQLQGGLLGLLDDGRAGPVEEIPVAAESRIEIWDLASIVTSQSLLSGEPVVRVIEQPRPDGSSAWILQIPGTQEWHPRAGEVPHDLTADLQLMGFRQAALTQAALAALAAAQRGSGRLGRGDPVLVTGHSLGGIAAMSIAATPGVAERLNVTHVVTVGSPVGYFVVPDDVQVVSLEHHTDPVPRLDLVANPDRPNWTTVRRDVPGSAPVIDVGSHGAIPHRETARLAARAIEDGTEPSLVHWAATAAPFFRPGRTATRSDTGAQEPQREQRVRDYRLRRVTQSRS